MADSPDFYEVLQVHPKASPLMIKKAYRTLLLAGAHPDLGGNKSATQLLNEAYETLADPDRRLAYDRRRGVGREKPTTILISVCPNCGVYNRVLSETRLLIARCGKCSKPLGRLSTSPTRPLKARARPWKWIWGGVIALAVVAAGVGSWVWWSENRDPLVEAVALQDKGQLTLAAERLVILLESDPRNLAAHLRLGMVYDEQKKYDAAVCEFRKAIDLTPGSSRAYYLLGRAQVRLGQFPEAEQALRKAIDLDPQEVGSLVTLGNLLVRLDRTEEAIAFYRRAIALDSHNSDLYFSLGSVYQVRGQLDEAVEAYQQALTVDPRHRESLMNLGKLYQDRGSIQDALTQYQRAAILHYEDPDLHFRLAELFKENGDTTRAMSELKISQGQVRGNAILAERIARAMRTMGEPRM